MNQLQVIVYDNRRVLTTEQFKNEPNVSGLVGKNASTLIVKEMAIAHKVNIEGLGA